MDRIWAESQLDLLRQGADNATNFSTVSGTAQKEMGSTKVRCHQMNSCCLSQCRAAEKENLSIPPPPAAFSLNAEECMYKLGAGPVHITFILHLRILPIKDGILWEHSVQLCDEMCIGLLMDSFIGQDL